MSEDNKPNGAGHELPPANPPAPILEPADINGRLAELTELLSATSSRCAGLRGQIAMRDQALAAKEQAIAKLTQELMRYREKEQEEAKDTVLSRKGPAPKDKPVN